MKTTTFILPAGYVDEKGEVHREAEVAEWSGRVQADIARPENRNNGAKITDAVLAACLRRVGAITEITPKLLKDLLAGDRDYLLIRSRQISRGDEVRVPMQCGACDQKYEAPIRLNEFPKWMLDGVPRDHDGEGGCPVTWVEGVAPRSHEPGGPARLRAFFTRSAEHGVRAAFRLPDGWDQHRLAPIVSKNAVDARHQLYALCCLEWNEGVPPFSRGHFEELPVRVLEWLDEEFRNHTPGLETDFTARCPTCDAAAPARMEASDFLFSMPRPRRPSTTRS